jgi:multisubunit Na+/H+ antiporter MnhE subunit
VSPTLPNKPEYLQAIGLMCLGDNILLLLWLMMSGFTSLIPLGGLYMLAICILNIRYARRLLNKPIKATEPNKLLAWIQIFSLFTGDVISPIVGVLSLVLYKNSDVQHYFFAVQALQARETQKV